MRTFLLLLAIDIAIVAGGIALFGQSRPAGGGSAGDTESMSRSRLLSDEARTLRREAERLEERADRIERARASAPGAAAGATSDAAAFPEDELDRLEAAMKAVQERAGRARAREGLLIGVRHVYPELSPDQQRDVARAIGAYREHLEAGVRDRRIQAGYEAGVREMRRLLQGVVDERKANEIVKRYCIQPGPPSKPPEISPPVRRK